jgi:hypothetical protein
MLQERQWLTLLRLMNWFVSTVDGRLAETNKPLSPLTTIITVTITVGITVTITVTTITTVTRLSNLPDWMCFWCALWCFGVFDGFLHCASRKKRYRIVTKIDQMFDSDPPTPSHPTMSRDLFYASPLTCLTMNRLSDDDLTNSVLTVI